MSADQWDVLLPSTIDPSGPESIADIASFVSYDEYPNREALLEDVDRFHAIIVRVTEISAELVDAATNLEIISKHGAGVDNIDIQSASRRRIVVCNTPGVNARSVAEHAITLILAVRKSILPADEEVRSGGWERHQFLNRELSSDVIGLLGFGSIARETAEVSRGFDMECIAYDPFVADDDTPDHVEKIEAKRELFERADVVSVHTPLTPKTRNAVSADELEALGPEGVIVNTSRGGVVDESALVDALDRGTIAGAGVDVFAEEPPESSHPLFDRQDAVLTPHVGGLTREALERMSRGAAANVRTVYEGNLPDSTVNADEL